MGVVIRHTGDNVRLRNKKTLAMAQKFGEEVGKLLHTWANEKKLDWDNPDPTNLLSLRRTLLEYIRSGMYQRKDMEVEMGAVLASLWFNRLEAEQKSRILTWD